MTPASRRGFFACFALALCTTAHVAFCQNSKQVVPGASWQKVASLKDAGWSAERLEAARRYSESISSAAVMIVQGGEVVTEWGDVSRKINGFSIRKSLISALYGIYSAEGAIDINQTLEQMGIDDAPDPLTKEERQARVVDLLRARSGVYHEVNFETAAMKQLRPPRGSHAPGTFWYYNNWDFNALGTIFERQSQLKIADAFQQRIAKPIGMQDYEPSDVFYLGGPVSIHKGYMFEISARDLARFGLLYLRHGRWGDRQIVPESWVEKSSHADEMVKWGNRPVGGYEYLWWVEYGGVHIPESTLPGMYSARGAGGHFVLIVPSLDLVIVHRANNEPKGRDANSVIEAADSHAVSEEQFGHLVKLILDSRSEPK